MAQFQVEHQEIVDEVGKYYVMPADSSVTSFLESHRAIPALLLEAAPQLKKYFGTEVVVSLSTSSDETGSQALYGVVYWTGSIADVRAALAKFDEDWWLTRVAQASGYLTFTYELR